MIANTTPFKLYIPSEISSDSNLNLSEMKVLSTIKALDNQNSCFASNSYLAECLGLSVRQISRIITALVNKNYIIVENGKSFRRKIKILKKDLLETKEVEQVKPTEPTVKENVKKEFSSKKTNTYKPSYKSKVSDKIVKFNSMYSHEYDMDDLEELASLNIRRKLGSISDDEYFELATPALTRNNIW